jgi:D-amino-acid dehydrogenase
VLAWRRARNRAVILLIARTDDAPGSRDVVTASDEDVIVVSFVIGATPIGSALAAAEERYTREVTTKGYLKLVLPPKLARKSKRKTLIVGAGIVGLMTALRLRERGFAVEVFERSGNPTITNDWTKLGCTHGGENARMFSLTECDNYHDQTFATGIDLHGQMNRNIRDMGWLMGEPGRYTQRDAAWASEFLSMPIWLSKVYNDDIFDLSHESFARWKYLIDARPQLFDNVEFKAGLLRIASTRAYHEKQLKRQKGVNAFIRELDIDRIVAEYPALAEGCANGEIVGGIEVAGFTVNVHDFAAKLIALLADIGVVFHWNTPVEKVVSSGNAVAGLRIAGQIVQADHYFLSPGAYGEALLDGTESGNKVHGVLGAWIKVPNLEPKLQRSLKISREGHLANSGNIIVARESNGDDVMIFGSGFGYVGCNVDNIDLAQLEALFESMEDYIKRLFTAAYRQALESGDLRRGRRYCIRPWTPSSLGVFEIRSALNGIMVVASGHNTGGFAQSTSIAEATVDAMEGTPNAMHTVYHPKRFDGFWPLDRAWAVSPA